MVRREIINRLAVKEPDQSVVAWVLRNPESLRVNLRNDRGIHCPSPGMVQIAVVTHLMLE